MKKRNLLLLLVMLVPIIFIRVDAKKFTVNEVVTEFNKVVSEKYKVTLGNMEASIDADNKKISLTKGKQDFSLSYTDDYIEYKYAGSTPTGANNGGDYYIELIFEAFLDSLFGLSNVSGIYSTAYLGKYESNFDKYNVSFDYTDYKYNGKNDKGESVELEDSYVSDFKLGFDSDKITNFAKTYAKSNHFDIVPKLNMKISNGKVNYNFKIDYTKQADEDIPYCVVFRAEALDGTYTKITENSISCEERDISVYLVDDTTTAGKTYFYKAQVVGSNKFSNILKVDLTSNIITDTSNNEIIYSPSKDDDKEDKNTPSEDKKEEEIKKDYKNPETGAFLPMLPILILALASIVVWSKVKNKFMRI